MSMIPETLLFLPGASGNRQVWQRMSDRLDHPARRRFLGWPGFGDLPADPNVNGFDALEALVARELTAPTAVFAQSMGGSLALRATLAKPEFVTHLVLSVTSAGIDVASLGGTDWRPDYRREFPDVPPWFETARVDLTALLPTLRVPVLLLWGNADPISPVAVGERLRELIPDSELVVVDGGTHDLIFERADDVMAPIRRHLQKAIRQ